MAGALIISLANAARILGCRRSEALALIETGQIRCLNFDMESELYRIDQASVVAFAEKIELDRKEKEKRKRRSARDESD